jgi:hypothetical protein
MQLLALAGCAQMPIGPTVAVMPGPHKPFDVFVAEDRLCRDWAAGSIGVTLDAATQRFVGSTAAGTAVGAAVGALAGGHGGAQAGAAVGMVTGTAVGADLSYYAAYSAQQAYDIAYQQCMYAKGNQLPGSYASRYRGADESVTPLPPAGIQPAPRMR